MVMGTNWIMTYPDIAAALVWAREHPWMTLTLIWWGMICLTEIVRSICGVFKRDEKDGDS